MSYITDTSTPASKVIHLDSAHASINHIKDDEGNVITSDFVYYMNEAITCPDHLSMLCSLHSATIPYSFYNIRNGINNELVLQYTDPTGFRGGRYKIVFPSGSYTALSFINTFQAIMTGSANFLGNPWESASGVPQYRIYYWQYNVQWVPLVAGGVGYNPFTDTSGGKVATIVNALLDRTRLRYHIYETNSPVEPQTTYIDLLWNDTETTTQDLFGFRADAPTRIPYSSDKTIFLSSDKVIDMNDEIHGLYLRTSLTTDGTLNSETGTFSNILARISIDTNFGGVIFHTPNNSSHKLQISLPVIKYIGVKLTDDKNRLIDLNGLNFQVSVQIDFLPRLQSLKGMTRAQRRDGEKEYIESQQRIKSKSQGIQLQDTRIEVKNQEIMNNMDQDLMYRKKRQNKIAKTTTKKNK